MLAGLEILSKVFDQQSSPMVSKILQQVRGIWGRSGGHPPPTDPSWTASTDPTMAPSMGGGKACGETPTHPAPSHPSQIASGLCYLGLGEALGWVWDSHCSAGVSCWGFQTAGQSGEQELENLVLKLSVLKDFLSSIEKKVRLEVQGWMA